jgi:GntR family transcriptional regulator
MRIDKKSPIPAYYQLKNLITEKIKSGEYTSGALLPSEREFVEKLGISRMTVRHAMNELVSENILYREKGKGTFVSMAKIEQTNIMSFSEIALRRGMTPVTQVLKISEVEPPEEIPAVLGLGRDERIYELKRLRMADNIPVAIEHNFLPCKYFPGLDELDLTSSLYGIIENKYSHTISYMDTNIEALTPDTDTAASLNMPSSTPVLYISGTIYTDSGIKLLHERSIYRSDKFKYNVRVYREK